jgi:hypothetical protein
VDKTERIQFASQDYWEFKTYLTVAQERQWVQHAIDAQITLHDGSPELVTSLARRMDLLVIAQTVEWSYGPVTLETFYEIPSHHYAEVADRMGDLYSPLVLRSIERGLQLYTSLSSPKVG